MKERTDEKPTASNILEKMKSELRDNPFDPSENHPELVYGPPHAFDPSLNEIVDVYGPPDDQDVDNENYDPMANVIPPVYGPPA